MKVPPFIILFLTISVAAGAQDITRTMTKKEKELLAMPLGRMVEVDGKQMCVYSHGEGEKTLIFMSGSGICSPILDFKSLYSLLDKHYRIIVIEKFGYGFSDIVEGARPIGLIMEQSRKALAAAGIAPPYVLCPHSMSGLEALYWAQTYPEEVSAIIGLDMALPEHYKAMDKQKVFSNIKLGKTAANLGMTRILPGEIGRSAVRHGTLTTKEKEIYLALFHTKTYNATVVNESLCVFDNAEIVGQGKQVETPMLLFVSNGKGGTGFKKEQWRTPYLTLTENNGQIVMIELDCPHMMHDYEYARISNEIIQFLDSFPPANLPPTAGRQIPSSE